MSNNNNKRLIQNPEEVQGFIFSTAAMAELLGVTDRRIQQLARDEIIDRVGRGRFNLQKTVQDLLNYWQKVAEIQKNHGDSKEDLEKEKYFHEKAKRQMSELKLAAMEGSMHEGEEVERVMTNMLANMRGKLLAIPSKLAPQLVARNEVAVIQSMIEDAVHESLNELSEYDPALFRSKQYVDLEVEEEDQVRSNEQ